MVLTRRHIDRIVTTVVLFMIMLSVVIVYFVKQVEISINKSRGNLSASTAIVDNISQFEDEDVFNYDIWIMNNSQIENLTAKLLKSSKATKEQNDELLFLLKKKKKNLEVYYVNDSFLPDSVKRNPGKTREYLKQRMASMDKVDLFINKNLEDKVNSSSQSIFVTSMATSAFIDSTKDMPVKKFASITTSPNSVSSVKTGDVKVVEYN